MFREVRVEDHAIWFSHVADSALRRRLEDLREDETVILLADGVVGKWRRMKTGKDGRPVHGIKPEGAMKHVWNNWFRTRKGDMVPIAEVTLADDYLAAGAALMSEWASPEDEEAFRDL